MSEFVVIKENCYLYSLWRGQCSVQKGDVKQNCLSGIVIFSFNPHYLWCAEEPKIVYNATVWLEARDDELAKSILIEYEERQILKLEKKLENHHKKIKILEGGVG